MKYRHPYAYICRNVLIASSQETNQEEHTPAPTNNSLPADKNFLLWPNIPALLGILSNAPEPVRELTPASAESGHR